MQLYFPSEVLEQVQRWAGACELVESAQRPRSVQGYYLWWYDGRLVLYRGTEPDGVCLQPAAFERRASIRAALARACGVTRHHKPRVLDAMAGLGVDGMTLNALGCEIVMIERNPTLWAMLDSFVGLFELTGRGRAVVHADAWAWLERSAPADSGFDVVYLDPMFPVRHKGALPGKSMQFLADIAETDQRPLIDWVALAKRCATNRVVLKRRQRDATVGVPDWQINGRSVRFDVYRGASS